MCARQAAAFVVGDDVLYRKRRVAVNRQVLTGRLLRDFP